MSWYSTALTSWPDALPHALSTGRTKTRLPLVGHDRSTTATDRCPFFPSCLLPLAFNSQLEITLTRLK